MQKGYQKHFRKRALYYTTYPINEQGRLAHELYVKEKAINGAPMKFVWDYDLKPVIVSAQRGFKSRRNDGCIEIRISKEFSSSACFC